MTKKSEDDFDTVDYMDRMDNFNYRTTQGLFNAKKKEMIIDYASRYGDGHDLPTLTVPKCNDHTQTKEENGECCQTKIKKE